MRRDLVHFCLVMKTRYTVYGGLSSLLVFHPHPVCSKWQVNDLISSLAMCKIRNICCIIMYISRMKHSDTSDDCQWKTICTTVLETQCSVKIRVSWSSTCPILYWSSVHEGMINQINCNIVVACIILIKYLNHMCIHTHGIILEESVAIQFIIKGSTVSQSCSLFFSYWMIQLWMKIMCDVF